MLTTHATRWLAVVLFVACAVGFAQAAPQESHAVSGAKPAVAKEGQGAAAGKPAVATEGQAPGAGKPAAAKAGPGAAAANAPAAPETPSVDDVLQRIEAIKAQAVPSRPAGTAAAKPGRTSPAVRTALPAVQQPHGGVHLEWPRSLVTTRDLGVRLIW
jgi:hypothetical protein